MRADLDCCSSLLIQWSETWNKADLAYEELYWSAIFSNGLRM